MLDLCGIELAGPVLNGSGTFDAIAARRAFGDVLLERFPFDAFVSKTITLEPREGNPPPRLWETPAGLINSIGLPNKGLEGFLGSDLPQLAELPVPLIVSVMGFSRDELATLVTRVGEREEVALIELNVSCPNVETGLIMGANPVETARALETVRPLTTKGLIVKLTPNCASPAAVAVAAEQHGADAVSLVNTLRGMAMHPRRPGEPWLEPPRRRERTPSPSSTRSRAWRSIRAPRSHGSGAGPAGCRAPPSARWRSSRWRAWPARSACR